MVIDTRGLTYTEIFNQIKEIIPFFNRHQEEFLVFVEAGEHERLKITKGFIERLLKCEAESFESSGFYVIRAIGRNTVFAN